MNLASLGAAYPGFQAAQTNIAQLAQARQTLDAQAFELAQKRRGLEALAMSVSSAGGGMPQPGAGPTAPQGGAPFIPPEPTAPQMSQSAGAPPAPPVAAPAPQPGFESPGMGGIGKMPQMEPQPIATPIAETGPSPAAAADPAAPSDFFKKSSDVLNAIVAEIKQANPHADPATLAMAVQARLNMLNDIDPETKAAAALQVKVLSEQLRLQADLAKAANAAEQAAALNEYRARMATVAEGRASTDADYKNRTVAVREKAGAGGAGDIQKSIDKLLAQKTSAHNTFSNATSRSITPQQYQIERENLATTLRAIDTELETLRAKQSATPSGAAPAPAASGAEPKKTQAQITTEAKDAIARGAPRDAVIAAVKQKGYSADGL